MEIFTMLSMRAKSQGKFMDLQCQNLTLLDTHDATKYTNENKYLEVDCMP